MTVPKRKMVIDTDAGVDDALAMILALHHPDWEVLAITCCYGNVSVDQACNNVARLLTTLEREDIPLYKGASRPLLEEKSQGTWSGHGTDGFGDAILPCSDLKSRGSAIPVLIKLFQENENCHLVCLGPLTNVALAVSLEPDFANLVKPGYFTIMGGAHLCQGNSGLASEFNIHQDPEAASICFSRFPLLKMLSWEVTLTAPFPKLWCEQVLSKDTKLAKLTKNISQKYLAIIERSDEGLVMCDAVAMATVLKPEIILESKILVGHVELYGHKTRGATVFDWMKKGNVKGNVEVVMKVDTQIYIDYCTKILS